MSFLLSIISNPVLVGITARIDGDACLCRSIAELTLRARCSAFIRRAAEVIGVKIGAPRRKLRRTADGGDIRHSLIRGITYDVHGGHVIAKSSDKVRFHTINIADNHR